MLKNFVNIYKNKKVFLTGHTGFKGSWLMTWLHVLGAKVYGYALPPENEFDLFHLIHGEELCHSELADIRDTERLQKSILDFQPDFIFHLAAQPLVRLSYEIPIDTFDVNVMGTAHVLNALRFLNKPCVAVMITTDKVYHNRETNYYYKETDRLGGYDPYSASKAAAEIIIDCYRKSYFNISDYSRHGKSIAVARAGNVIGGGDWAKDRIIPDIIRALQNNEPVFVRNPLAVRPWQHVLEPINGYLTLAAFQYENPVKFADSFNFGPYPQDNLTVEQIVKEAIEIWGHGEYYTKVDDTAPHEAHLLQLDINKAKDQLGWLPRYTAAKAINETVLWYKNVDVSKKENAFAYTAFQIKQYESAL